MTTWTERTEPTTTFNERIGYLLAEDGSFLLKEDGGKIVLADLLYTDNRDWTERTEPTTNWTN
jgi:hypothetical protein